jgi:hypothetical protein
VQHREALTIHRRPQRSAALQPAEALAAVIEETEARCPVMNLLRDAKVDLRIEWVRSSDGTLEALPGVAPPH